MILTPPKSKYKYHFDQSMFITIWKIYTILSILFFFLTIKHYINNNPNFYVFIGSFFMSVASLLMLKYSGRYLLSAILGVVLGSIFCQFSIFYIPDHSGLADVLWIMLISLFAFYSLGSWYGFIVLLLNMTGAIYKYVYIHYSYIHKLGEQEFQASLIDTIINVVIVTLTIAYLTHKIIQASVVANKEFQEVNNKLITTNNELQNQYNEKSILLKEIHHRVKNNLQVISSLIRLQSFETDDTEVKKMFEATVSRVVAMALIHEKMYQKDNLSKINLEDYLESLADDIFKSYTIDTKIDFSIRSNLEVLGNRTIVPVALIFNELISNSIKHAFKEQKNGEIKITIESLSNNMFMIKYFDSGTWKEPKNPNSFGLELIQTFINQLDGELKREITDEGTTYIFNIKNID